MHKRIITVLWLTFLLIIIGIVFHFEASTIVQLVSASVQGVADVKDDGSIHNLSGEWYYAQGRVVAPDEIDEAVKLGTMQLVDVPHAWTSEANPSQYATYAVKLQTTEGQLYSLHYAYPSTALQVFYGEQFLGENGRFSTKRENGEPAYKNKLMTFKANTQDTWLVIHVSNYHHYKGGLRGIIQVGEHKEVVRYVQMKESRDFFVILFLIIIGFYHVLLEITGFKDASLIPFGLTAMVLAIKLSVSQEMILFNLFPDLSYVAATKIDYFTFVLMIPLIVWLYCALTTNGKVDLAGKMIVGVSLAFEIAILLFPPTVFTNLLTIIQAVCGIGIVYVLYLLGKAIKRDLRKYMTVAVATLLLVLSIVNDILLNRNLIISTELITWGFVSFTVLMLYRAALSFAQALSMVSTYSQKLENQQRIMLQQGQLSGIGFLAAGVAHEINNPLGYAYSNIQLLLDDPKVSTDEDTRELLIDVLAGLQRVQTIVRNLQNFSGVDKFSGNEAMNINHGIDSVLMMLNSYMKEHIQVSKLYSDIPDIMADAKQINQALLQIILNAVDAIEARGKPFTGRIKVRTYVSGNYICIEVTDNGVGISQENMQKIFNPFYTTKPIGSGVGMGLAIAYDIIVMRHDGEIIVDSGKMDGTRVLIRLPIA